MHIHPLRHSNLPSSLWMWLLTIWRAASSSLMENAVASEDHDSVGIYLTMYSASALIRSSRVGWLRVIERTTGCGTSNKPVTLNTFPTVCRTAATASTVRVGSGERECVYSMCFVLLKTHNHIPDTGSASDRRRSTSSVSLTKSRPVRKPLQLASGFSRRK